MHGCRLGMGPQQSQWQVDGIFAVLGKARQYFGGLVATPLDDVTGQGCGDQVMAMTSRQVTLKGQERFCSASHHERIAPAHGGKQFDPRPLLRLEVCQARRAFDAVPQFARLVSRQQRIDRTRNLVQGMEPDVVALWLAALQKPKAGHFQVFLQRAGNGKGRDTLTLEQEVAGIARAARQRQSLEVVFATEGGLESIRHGLPTCRSRARRWFRW